MSADEREEFAQQVGDLFASWNLARATGRVYGRLLLESEPVGLDYLGVVADASKGAVSTAVRELVSWGLARTIAQPGSRRLLVEARGGLENLLAASQQRARRFVEVLRHGAELTDDPPARARLADVTDLFERYVDAGDQILRARPSGDS
ncbi:transcriptional regulator [Nocardia cyriacigeorgica]|uniref:Transcriptional regulator n=1 Tax=Nocardia cyriacigeorgica TaxID=135487 RepID=A0A6P1DD11_9NOCA|nr:transcriptional regulator [Nocardia cyriacigeorgica]NEW38205.1 transcriptional regulator [Nocardia cyriacigeorgica]NEW47044.1 transcriptional regulator [Nocardia cyriacigeorgica]NEW52650.1 transcriptional regulator [Nocardia cyriacigeorgica]NEW57648.1 transcriptional regulator [Nocardia cyriacigeorgica]